VLYGTVLHKPLLTLASRSVDQGSAVNYATNTSSTSVGADDDDDDPSGLLYCASVTACRMAGSLATASCAGAGPMALMLWLNG
jgi:hypothetical protein